jgi:hypothetical protein
MDRGSFAMRPCAFRDVQAVEACSRHAFPRHTHDGYGIGLIVRGAQRSWSGRGTVEAGPGSIITCQGRGVGSALISHLRAQISRPILVGTWAAATWAIRFYERHGFHLVPEATRAPLLRSYWAVSERQIETSVVLAADRLTSEEARELLERAEAGDH